MSTPHILRVAILTLLLLPGLARGSQWTPADSEYTVVSRFLTAVDAYVIEHHRLFEPLPDGMMCLPEDTIARLNALAEVPREARKAPREGAIFTPDVADLFRRRLATRFFGDEYSGADLVAEMEKREVVASPIRVNEPPAWEVDNAIQLPLLRDLPLLPEELEYQLVGRNLVLIDVPSNLVVDVIRAALPTD
jgi:hypothetical protein